MVRHEFETESNHPDDDTQTVGRGTEARLSVDGNIIDEPQRQATEDDPSRLASPSTGKGFGVPLDVIESRVFPVFEDALA